MAEGEGFEPPVGLTLRRFSKCAVAQNAYTPQRPRGRGREPQSPDGGVSLVIDLRAVTERHATTGSPKSPPGVGTLVGTSTSPSLPGSTRHISTLADTVPSQATLSSPKWDKRGA